MFVYVILKVDFLGLINVYYFTSYTFTYIFDGLGDFYVIGFDIYVLIGVMMIYG